ncbi:TIR domain-containing protein [Novosphingobium sp. JCM 18896]|uniref:TIR domain-containing protein n=1 Tax=Novosphingobium sp. JCM 18896 TaxID=2989731 RepID=UPI002222892A|nr:TIR domain-containing protein [Novosphingobium sp. JCM 18896]MCW1429200.1 TIR domain-containing protein [Novosphingobium sp. JCM 18896]
MVDVFISYSRKDEALVAVLARAALAEGYDVWWDAELPPHKSYGEVITDKIAEARATIVVWSADAVRSEWVRAEADMARNQRKLIQTAIDTAMPPLPFNQIQFAEIGDWRGEPDHPGWRKVKASLAELCGPRDGDARATPLPATPPPHLAAPAAPIFPRWPLFAGIGVAALGLAAAGGALLAPRGSAPAPDASLPAVPAVTSAPATVATEPTAAVAAAPRPAVTPLAVPVPNVPIARPPVMPPAPVAATPSPTPAVAAIPTRRVTWPKLLFPDSSRRPLTAEELAPLTRQQLLIALNEMPARHGFRFKDPALLAHFSQYPWYDPRLDQVSPNPVERQNTALIRQAMQARNGN